MKTNITLYIVLHLAVLTMSNPVFAAGGGGGSGGFSSPSQSAPRIDPVATYQKGIEAFQAGEYKQAERAFRKVLKVSRKDPNSNYLLGLSLIQQNKHKKARKPLEKATKYDPDMVMAKGYLGSVYRVLGKVEKAEKQYQDLLTLKSQCDGCDNAAKIDAALEKLNAAPQPQASLDLQIDQQLGDHSYLEAVASINRGDYRVALASLADSARAFGPHPDILTYQGFAHRKLGNKHAALRFYQAALTVQPNHRGANEYLGEYYVETGRLDLAKQQLVKLEQICQFGCEEAEELRRWIDSGTS